MLSKLKREKEGVGVGMGEEGSIGPRDVERISTRRTIEVLEGWGG